MWCSFRLPELLKGQNVVRAGLVACFADIYGFAKALQCLGGKIKVGFGKLRVNELLRHGEDEVPFGVTHLKARDLRLIPGCLETSLAFAAPFEQVSDSKVVLLRLIEVIGSEQTRIKNWKELRITLQHGIGTKASSNFLRLALVDLSAIGFEGWVVRQSKINRFIESQRMRLRGCGP
jgi:hypothetical protein